MPSRYVGKRVLVTVGRGKQLDGSGELMGGFPAFRRLDIQD